MERILVVEDDRFFRNLYCELLKDEGYEIDTAPSFPAALDSLSRSYYSLVITELVLHDMSGLDLLSRIKQQDPTIDVIIVTSHANVESAIYALKNGARDYLIKPFNHDEFKHTVALCMEQRRLIDENQELKGLLNIYQVGQTIANCLEPDRLYPLVVDSLAKEVGVESCLGFFVTEAGHLELTEIRGFSDEEGGKLSRVILPVLMRRNVAIERIRPLSDLVLDAVNQGVMEPAVAGGLDEALVLYIRSRSALLGLVVFFNDYGREIPTDINLKNVTFILDQSSLAIENAGRYATVKNLLYIDELTGLNNYRYLDIALDREIKRAERSDSKVSVIFLDLDLFKNVNDRYGHLIGSRVLKEVGTLLKGSVREFDTIIRYGGDEYTVILGDTPPDAAAVVAERIRSSIESHRFLDTEGYDISLTACLGFACYPDDTRSKQELLDMADHAMYCGKTGGRNLVFPVTSEENFCKTPAPPADEK